MQVKDSGMSRISLAFMLFAIALVVSCAPPPDPRPKEFTGRIGTAGPMSGKYSVFGDQMRHGAEMAVADLNAAGGVLGKQLVLEIGDDLCEPRRAVRVANEMVNKGVSFVAGHFCSGSSIPASAVYEEEGVVMISPASTNPRVTEQNHRNVFRVCGRDDHQGTVAGNLLADEYGSARIAILHDGTGYGKGLADRTRKQLNDRGVREVMHEAYRAGGTDYSALVSEMKAASVDVFYVGGYHYEAGLIVRQAHEQGFRPQLVTGDALVTDDFWRITGEAGEGALMTFSPDPRKDPAGAAVVDRFRAAGIEPEGYTLYTYAAIQAWAKAVEEAGTADSPSVIKALRSSSFDTVLGRLGFDQKGDVTGIDTFVWYVWSNGTYDHR